MTRDAGRPERQRPRGTLVKADSGEEVRFGEPLFLQAGGVVGQWEKDVADLGRFPCPPYCREATFVRVLPVGETYEVEVQVFMGGRHCYNAIDLWALGSNRPGYTQRVVLCADTEGLS